MLELLPGDRVNRSSGVTPIRAARLKSARARRDSGKEPGATRSTRQLLTPSPGTPGEGWDEGFVPTCSRLQTRKTLTLPSPRVPGEGMLDSAQCGIGKFRVNCATSSRIFASDAESSLA